MEVNSASRAGTKWAALWPVLALALLAVTLRVGWPTLTEFKFSEARLEALALELTREGRLPLIGVPSSAGFDHSPVSVYLYLPTFLFTANPIPATIYGGLVGAAATVWAWWLARRWPGGGRTAALVTLLLFAASPWAVMFSRKIWQVAFVPLLSTAIAALMVSTLTGTKRWSVTGAIVAYAFLVQVHPSALAMLPAFLLWLAISWRQLRVRPVLTGGALGVLSLVPMLVHQVGSGWPAWAALKALPAAQWDLKAVQVAWQVVTGQALHGLAGEASPHLALVPQLEVVFGVVGVLLVMAAIVLASRMIRDWGVSDAVSRKAARVDLILLTWLLVPIAFNLRHSLDLPLHFMALLLPPTFLVLGRAAQIVIECFGVGVRWAARTVLVVTAVCQVGAVLLLLRLAGTHNTQGGFGVPLRDYLRVTGKVLALAREESAHEVVVSGEGSSPDVSEIPAVFDVLLRDRIPYRFADGDSAAVLPDHRALVLLSPEPVSSAVRWYDGWPMHSVGSGFEAVILDGTWPSQAFEPISAPRLFENGVEVQGYALETAMVPESTGRLWLLWQVLWQSGSDSHFTVRIVDEDSDRVLAQVDGPGLPVESRRRGDRVISKFDITLSVDVPAIDRWLVVGQYRYPEIASIPVVGATGTVVGEAVLTGPLQAGW